MSNLTRIYKKGNFYIFQSASDLSRINTLTTQRTDYNVASGRHYFKIGNSTKYSFAFKDILDENGKVYSSEEKLIQSLSEADKDTRSNQVLHRIITGATTNNNLIREGVVKTVFSSIIK